MTASFPARAGAGIAALALLVLLAAPACAAPRAPSAAFGQPLPAPESDALRTSIYVTMPDGTRLAADIYRPARNGVALPGRFPAILHATSSRQRFGDTVDRSGAGDFSKGMINLASHAYVYVQFERRGLGASFGVRRGYHDRTEAQDSQDMIKWVVSQDWSDGKVGAYGCSNTGDAAMHFLTLPSPHLKAVFAGCFNWDKYSGGRRGGVLANWGTGPQSSFEQDMKATPVDGDEDRVLLRQAALGHAPNTPLFAMWSGMPFRDSVSPLTGTAFWEEGSIGTYAQQVRASKVPVYVQGGWNDDFRAQGFIVLENLPQPTKLIIGPWGHCQSGDFSMTAEAKRFFDYWLKGVQNGIMDEPRIHYTTDNAPPGKEWRTAERLPLRPAAATPFYLGQRTAQASNDHALGLRKPARPGSTSFQVRYDALCARGTGLGSTCPQDDKGITFTSAALDKDVEVTGFPVADLWVSSSAADGPLFAYLEDIGPDGAIAMVSEGRLKASLRTLNEPPYKLPEGMLWHGFHEADAKPLSPGVPVRMAFELMPVSHIFKAGHRYRLTLTGADPREKERVQLDPAPTWTLHFDAKRPSLLVLPIVKGA
jgi:putative CocE/NonD family hydrolase